MTAQARISKAGQVGLAFDGIPAEQRGHLRTTNAIESNFSMIRLRHRRAKGGGSRKASRTTVLKVALSASHRNG